MYSCIMCVILTKRFVSGWYEVSRDSMEMKGEGGPEGGEWGGIFFFYIRIVRLTELKKLTKTTRSNKDLQIYRDGGVSSTSSPSRTSSPFQPLVSL